MKHSYSNDDTCFSIDVIDEILEEDFDALLDEGSKILHSIEGTILGEEIISKFDKFIAITAEENYDSKSDTEEPQFEKITINTDYKIKTSLEEPPTDLELKPLPDNLEYVFLEEPSFLPVIISSQLFEKNKSKLVSILKKHKEAFAWKTTDIPSICPSFCKHKIQLLNDKKPVVQKQRRLNPNMQEVVKKEIMKLLDTDIIYPIADSPWVSHVHCVPKKCGITIVTNENDELVPTRTVMGWCMLAIFHDMIEDSVEVFMDDFSVFGNSFDKCLNNLNKMLQRCKDAHLVLNWENVTSWSKRELCLDTSPNWNLGIGYQEKDKNKDKADKTEHENEKSVRKRVQAEPLCGKMSTVALDLLLLLVAQLEGRICPYTLLAINRNKQQLERRSQQEKKETAAQSLTPYWNFSMIDDEEARENFMKDICTFLRKFSRISFGVMPKVLSIAWERFGEIKDALTDKQYRQEDIQELTSKLLEDYTIIYSKPKAITPDLPDNSLSMGDEHLDTIPSVENLVPIPSEFEGISEDTCDVPVCEDPSTFDVLSDHSEILSDSNNDGTSSDDDDFEDIEYVSLEEMNDVDQEEKEIDLDDILQIQDVILREKLLNISRLITNIESLKDNPILDHVFKSSSSFPIPVTNSDSFFEKSDEKWHIVISDNSNDPLLELPEFESFHFDPSFPRPPPEPPDVEICLNFEPDTAVINRGEIDFSQNVEDDDTFTFVIRTFLPFLTYPMDSPLLLSTGSEDTIFDLGIYT
ncbi:hypothetical protein Tco_1473410 [Tanacetum coccineum]